MTDPSHLQRSDLVHLLFLSPDQHPSAVSSARRGSGFEEKGFQALLKNLDVIIHSIEQVCVVIFSGGLRISTAQLCFLFVLRF